MRKIQLVIILLLVGVIGFVNSVRADFDRSLEAVIVNASAVGEFLNKDIDGVRIYVYSSQTENWRAIPFQVDEFIWNDYPSGSKDVVWNGDGLLTQFDEIVFMAVI